ncbi:MAG: MATE family efflux transporter [Anaerovoracaceae bacterium]|jgi:Na+-driven multidrug efflux pump
MAKNKIRLSDHFTYRKLIRFVLPSIVMMLFTSIYNIVDGLFVSNFAGKEAYSAINIILPVLMIMSAVGFMLGTGGSAVVAKTLGEGDKEKANRYFSMFVYATLIIGVVLMIIGQIMMVPVTGMLGATGEVRYWAIIYGRINMCSLPFFMVQVAFQSFFNSAGKPGLGLLSTVITGIGNMVLDTLFVAVCGWGLVGAAVATTICEFLGGMIPIVYFARKNTSNLKLGKPSHDIHIFFKGSLNGISEFMTNIATSIVAIMYNLQLIKLIGQDGVAAYGTMQYINFMFSAVFIGYSLGSAAITSFNHGAQNYAELRNIFVKSIRLILITELAMFGIAELCGRTVVGFFVGYDEELMNMTLGGFRIFAVLFLMAGINIFASAFFTALNNGIISACISLLRSLVFEITMIMLLPSLFGAEAIWAAAPTAEFLAVIVSISLLAANRKRYHYGKNL